MLHATTRTPALHPHTTSRDAMHRQRVSGPGGTGENTPGSGQRSASTTRSMGHALRRGGGQRGARLVLLALLLALALGRLGADLLVVLLEGGEVLAGLGELALLHA